MTRVCRRRAVGDFEAEATRWRGGDGIRDGATTEATRNKTQTQKIATSKKKTTAAAEPQGSRPGPPSRQRKARLGRARAPSKTKKTTRDSFGLGCLQSDFSLCLRLGGWTPTPRAWRVGPGPPTATTTNPSRYIHIALCRCPADGEKGA